VTDPTQSVAVPDLAEIFGSPPSSGPSSAVSGPSPSGPSMPFTPRYSSMKKCPDCSELKPTGPDHWYRQTVTRKVPHDDGEDQWSSMKRIVIDSTYCRLCTNKRKAAESRYRRMLNKLPADQRDAAKAKHLRGPCGVCGRVVKGRLMTKGSLNTATWHGLSAAVPACQWCHATLEKSGYDPLVIRSQWASVWKHCSEEERFIAERRRTSDRGQFPYHTFNPNWPKANRFSHGVCLDEENHLKVILRWLTGLLAELPD